MEKADVRTTINLDDELLAEAHRITGELACGDLSNRAELLRLLGELPRAKVAAFDEALGLIERHAVMGRGIGYVDALLLATSEPG